MYVASSRLKAFDCVQSNIRSHEVQSTQEIEKGFIEVTVNGTIFNTRRSYKESYHRTH